jgi:hypothetical protein
MELARGIPAVLACLESPQESVRVACLGILAPILRRLQANPGASPPPGPAPNAVPSATGPGAAGGAAAGAGGGVGAGAVGGAAAGAKGIARLRVLTRSEPGAGGAAQGPVLGPGFASAAGGVGGGAGGRSSAVVDLLGGMVRGLMQHSNSTAASVGAAMALVVPGSQVRCAAAC